MPELPEVETVRRGLKEYILNKKIIQIRVFCEKSFFGDMTKVVGAKIIDIRRFGKMLVVDFDNGVSIMIHLRMTGQLIYVPEGAGINERFAAGHPSENFVQELPNGQTRVVFELDGGTLYFNDQRKFGFCKVVRTEEVEEDTFVRKLGPEPWGMDGEKFYKILQRRKGSPIKAVLLDQTVMAGLGNIYADEAAFFAGVNPATRAGKITRDEAEKLVKGARAVMERSIEAGGSTMRNYVKADGTRGDYLTKFAKVFGREGQKCLRCGTEIKKTRVAGRGTYFCPKCQKEKK